KQIKEKSTEELKTSLKDGRKALFTMKLEKAQNKLKNTRAIFLKRKEIAIILTELRWRELNAKNL
ncbi:MAG: 50S ribosomal protein L29, partial [Candidatus Levybacteria bacterium RBG_16_35_6]